ncbi:MAG: hypothetical protein ACT4RN_08370 [Pseudonocardia sp.]
MIDKGDPVPRAAAILPRSASAARDRLQIAVDEACAIAGPAWRQEAERRVSMSFGPALYWRAREAAGICDDVAEVANRLARRSVEGDRAMELVLTPRLLEQLHHPGTTKLVTRNLAAQTVPAPSTSTVTLVNALRALGVLHCVRDGRDLMRCRCLWPLARHEHEQKIRNDVRMVVRFGLDRIPAAWMVVEPAH